MQMNILLSSDLSSFDVDFSKITSKQFVEAYDTLLEAAEAEFKQNLNIKKKKVTYQDIAIQPAYEKLMALHHLMGSLNSLIENEEYRNIEEKYTGILSGKLTEWSLNSKVFNKLEFYSQTEQFKALSPLRQKMILEILKDRKTSGVNLPSKGKKQLTSLNKQLAKLGQKFQNNITDAQENLSFVIDEADLEGLPQRSINNAKELSKGKKLAKGKIFIDAPSGLIDDVMSTSKNEKLRKMIYMKRRDLCSKGKYKNTVLIDKIYKLKQKVAELLSYKDFAHMVVEENMAKTPQATLQFLNDLGTVALPFAKKETEFVAKVGKELLGRSAKWWDSEYVINHMLKENFQVDPEKVRLYFPVEKVMTGLFELCKNLFDISFVENTTRKTWHPDVKFYDVFENDREIGGIFMDIYKRNGKTPGAWVDPLCTYENNDLRKVKPFTLLVCNAPKDVGQVSTFELEEVVTLFHEMGHALHHLLSKVEEEFFSGFNNVEHDAVEIPSQLMENFVYDKEVLKNISSHIHTGESIPDELIEKILKSKKFLGANMIVNMVRFSEMDMNLYMQKDAHPCDIEKEAMEKWKLNETYDKDRLRMPSFSHIFGGGYAAGYYAYQWAEVYAADGFNYLNSGTLDEKKEKVRKYKEEILYTGGAKSMKENYALFKPTEVDLNALINNYIDI